MCENEGCPCRGEDVLMPVHVLARMDQVIARIMDGKL